MPNDADKSYCSWGFDYSRLLAAWTGASSLTVKTSSFLFSGMVTSPFQIVKQVCCVNNINK